MSLSNKDIKEMYQLLQGKKSLNEILDIHFTQQKILKEKEREQEFARKFTNKYEMIKYKAELEAIIHNDVWANLLTIILGIFSILLVHILEVQIAKLSLIILFIAWGVLLIIVLCLWSYYSRQKQRAIYILNTINSFNEILENNSWSKGDNNE